MHLSALRILCAPTLLTSSLRTVLARFATPRSPQVRHALPAGETRSPRWATIRPALGMRSAYRGPILTGTGRETLGHVTSGSRCALANGAVAETASADITSGRAERRANLHDPSSCVDGATRSRTAVCGVEALSEALRRRHGTSMEQLHHSKHQARRRRCLGNPETEHATRQPGL